MESCRFMPILSAEVIGSYFLRGWVRRQLLLKFTLVHLPTSAVPRAWE